jgi:hypothetical protein
MAAVASFWVELSARLRSRSVVNAVMVEGIDPSFVVPGHDPRTDHRPV